MNSSERSLLSTLWIFVMLNYLYADVITLMDPTMLSGFLQGQVGPIRLTPKFLLGAAVMMEVPIAMTLLSRVLPWRANRIANLGAAAFKTVVVGASLFVGTSTAYYWFFALIEIATTIAIFAIAF